MGLFDSISGALFGNAADQANPYYDQSRQQLQQYMDPYHQSGLRSMGMLEGQFGNLLNDPGGKLNQMGQGYQESPGFKFALQQAMQGAGNAAAAGGMAGSPQHEQQNMGLATNLANQDYNQWLQNAMGLYGAGLSGAQNMYGIGAGASQGLGEGMSSLYQNQGMANMAGQQNSNNLLAGLMGSAMGAASPFGKG